MDAARAAAASDPDLNYHFRRRWSAPPLKLKAPPVGGTTRRGDGQGVVDNSELAKLAENFKDVVILVAGGAQ